MLRAARTGWNPGRDISLPPSHHLTKKYYSSLYWKLLLDLTRKRLRTLTDQYFRRHFKKVWWLHRKTKHSVNPLFTQTRDSQRKQRSCENSCFSQASWHFLVIPGITLPLFHVVVTLSLHNDPVSHRLPRWPRSLSGRALGLFCFMADICAGYTEWAEMNIISKRVLFCWFSSSFVSSVGYNCLLND